STAGSRLFRPWAPEPRCRVSRPFLFPAQARRAWAGLAVVAAACFVVSLDAMVLYVAFGNIRRDFPEVGAAALSWILSGYTIVVAAGMVGAGRWGDRLGAGGGVS